MNDLSMAGQLMRSLTVYRNLLADETVSRFLRLLSAAESGDAASFCALYAEFFHSLAEAVPTLDLGAHLEELVRFDDNAFSRDAARKDDGNPCDSLRMAAERDLSIIARLINITAGRLKQSFAESNGLDAVAALPDYTTNARGIFAAGDLLASLKFAETFYRRSGFGIYARYRSFRWQNGLVGVVNPDQVLLTDLKEYEYERGLVLSNTQDFLEGRGGGNLLLYGDRGTGKSSTVKALGSQYRDDGLRIVELSKGGISELHALLEILREVPLRFILFLDDLTFETDDAEFSALKSVLEGGVAARPENCRIYATSNRRHLVRESFSERGSDDVNANDTMQEKLALYDRFDQTVNFFAPDQERYLSIVRALAAERSITISLDDLERGAIQWAIRAGGRSPRTAKQYVDWASVQCQRGAPILD